MHFQALESCTCVQLKEKANIIEAASAILGQEIEMANKYKVMDGDTGTQLFYAVEQTDCLTRQLKQCCGDCAPWNVDILYTGAGDMVPALKMERPWTMTCCCLNRPVVSVTDVQTGELLGQVTDPCTFCNLSFTVTDQMENPIVTASGGCCQMGLCCPLPCGPCAEVSFPLSDPASGDDIGELKKKVPGILKFFLAPDVDNYTISFDDQGKWNGKTKALAIALAIFLDFRLFSENPNDDNGGLLDVGGDGGQE